MIATEGPIESIGIESAPHGGVRLKVMGVTVILVSQSKRYFSFLELFPFLIMRCTFIHSLNHPLTTVESCLGLELCCPVGKSSTLLHFLDAPSNRVFSVELANVMWLILILMVVSQVSYGPLMCSLSRQQSKEPLARMFDITVG
jgi:hypothetical protein